MQRLKASCSGLGTVCAAVLLAIVLSVPVQCQIISTAAGSTSWGGVTDVTFDASGNMYVPDYNNDVVYKVDKLANFSIVAGDGTRGYGGDGALATSAKLSGPIAAVVDSSGNLYIAEYLGNRIRKVAANGIITTFAGTGIAGFSGDGGPATSAKIYAPLDLLADQSGNVLFIDGGNNRIRKIAPGGTISTFAGTGRRAYGGDGGPALAADMFPSAFTFGPDGGIYFTDNAFRLSAPSPRIRKIGTDSIVSTVAGNGTRGFSGDGGPATAAEFSTADGIAVDASGTVYFSDFAGCRIRKVATSGIITTFAGDGACGLAGDGGDATQARVSNPIGMAVEADGTLYITDYGNRRIRKIAVPLPPAINSTTAGVPAFLGKAGFSSNSYLEIYGTNLAQTEPQMGPRRLQRRQRSDDRRWRERNRQRQARLHQLREPFADQHQHA